MSDKPHINDRTFFGLLDEAERALAIKREAEIGWPWQNRMEDRAAAEDHMTALYAKLGHKPPKFCWAQSPRSMFGAIKMLREIQVGQRQNLIKSLVPVGMDSVEAEAKRVLLEAVMDRNLTVTMGANLRDVFNSQFRGDPLPTAIGELANILARGFAPPLAGRLAPPAGWSDWVAYPMTWKPLGWLQSQAFVVAPFLHLCWLSRPPLFVKTEEGHLHSVDGPAVRFEDNFEVWCQHQFDDALPEPSDEVLALPAPEDAE